MLQNIREHTKGWVAGLVIILVGSTFVLFGVEYYVQQGSAQNAVVAKVDGHKITEKELDQAFRQVQKQQQAAMKGASFTSEQNQQLKSFALQALIRNFALSHAAEKSGFYVSLDQAKNIIMSASVFQVDGQFSNDRFQQFMLNSGLSPAEFFSQIQSSILISQVQSGLMDSEFVLPAELKRLSGLLKQTRSFAYFSIPVANFLNKIKVTDAEIKQFYSQNAKNFMTPEKVKLSYLILSPASMEKSVSVSDQEIKEYYEGNPANFSSMRRWQVNRYLIPLDAHASDEEVAKAKAQADRLKNEIQENAKTSVKPTLTWLTQDQVKGPIAVMISQLKQGDVSAPFRTTEGFNVIKLEQFEKGQTKSFASVRDEIKKALAHQKVQQLLTTKSEQLSNLVYTNPNTLEVAAKSLNIPVENSDWLTRSGNKTIFEPKIMDVVFSDEVLNQGNNSAPIELKDGSLMVVRVASHEKSAPLPLTAVKKEIHDILLNQQAQREAGLKAYEIQSKLQSGAEPAQLAKEYGVTWSVKDSISRKDKSLPPALLKAVFNLAPENKAKSVTSVSLGNSAYAVAMLTKVHMPSDAALNEKEQLLLTKSLAGLNAEIEYRLYTNSVLKASKIKLMDAKL